MSLHWEIEELALRACGKTEQETENFINESNDIEDLLYEKYEVSFEQYCKIVEDLIPFTPVMETAVTNTKVQGFVDGNTFIVKKDLAPKQA